MSSEKIKLASIGLGWWGGMLADAAERSGSCEIACGFARSSDTRKAFSEKYSCNSAENLDEILKDSSIDGLLVATPHSTHLDIISQAASAGKHVFVEKPLTLTCEDAKEAIKVTESAGVVLQVGHHRRRCSANRKIKSFIDSGELGVLHQMQANLSLAGGLEPRPGWRNDPEESPAGSMCGLGVHMVDNLQFLAGPAKRVSAFSKKLLSKTNLDDVTSFIIEYESGPLGYVGTTFVVPKICETSAFGTGMNAYSDLEGTKLYVTKSGDDKKEEISLEPIDPLSEQLSDFASCIKGEKSVETGGVEGLEVVAVLQSVIESSRTGKAIEVSTFRD